MAAVNPRVLVLLADGGEEMEATITVDVLRRAELDVVVAGVAGPGTVTCSRGVKIVPDVGLEDVSGPFEAVVLPGGAGGMQRLASSERVGDVLRRQEANGGLIGAICAAPAALARHGVAAGRAMTSHPSVREEVARHGSYREQAVVEDGELVTSRGPGTAFAFALALVARLRNPAVAESLRGPMMLG